MWQQYLPLYIKMQFTLFVLYFLTDEPKHTVQTQIKFLIPISHHSAASHLGLHCLHTSVCPNAFGKSVSKPSLFTILSKHFRLTMLSNEPLHCCIWRGLTKLSLWFSFFCVFFVSKGNLLDFYCSKFKIRMERIDGVRLFRIVMVH